MSHEQDKRTVRYGPAVAGRPSYVDTFENNRWVRSWEDDSHNAMKEHDKPLESQKGIEGEGVTVIALKEDFVKNLSLYQKEASIKMKKVLVDKQKNEKKKKMISIIAYSMNLLLALVLVNFITADSLTLDCERLYRTTKYYCAEPLYLLDGDIITNHGMNVTLKDVSSKKDKLVYNATFRFISSLLVLNRTDSDFNIPLLGNIRYVLYTKSVLIGAMAIVFIFLICLFNKYLALRIEICDDKEREFRKILNMKTEADKKVDNLYSSFKDYLARRQNLVL